MQPSVFSDGQAKEICRVIIAPILILVMYRIAFWDIDFKMLFPGVAVRAARSYLIPYNFVIILLFAVFVNYFLIWVIRGNYQHEKCTMC